MFNKEDKTEEEISEVAFDDLEPTELSSAYHKPACRPSTGPLTDTNLTSTPS